MGALDSAVLQKNEFIMPDRVHIIASFDESLERLRSELLDMGRMSRKSVELSVRGLLERNLDYCNKVIADDESINQYEKDVDELGIETLLKYRPVAQDLRLVLASMSISRNLERMADHAVYIAKRSRKILKNYDRQEDQLIEPLFTTVDKLFDDALRCFIDGDVELGHQMKERNREAKTEAKQLVKVYSRSLENSSELSEYYLHLIFIARSLQRIGSLSVNIAEDAVFHESAEDIRHIPTT